MSLLLTRRGTLHRAAVAAPPVGSPTDVAGLLYRWRADSIAQAAGSAVTSWPALTGGVALSQATATAQPTYQPTAVNGVPAVRFDGASDFLEASTPTRAQPVTAHIVVQLNVTAQQQLFLFDTSQIWSNGSAWAVNFGTTSITGGSPGTGWHILTVVMDGASSVVYDNGTQIIAGDPGTQGIGARFRVGQFSASRYLNGDVAEIVVYDHALSASERNTVHAYAASRYGITVA